MNGWRSSESLRSCGCCGRQLSMRDRRTCSFASLQKYDSITIKLKLTFRDTHLYQTHTLRVVVRNSTCSRVSVMISKSCINCYFSSAVPVHFSQDVSTQCVPDGIRNPVHLLDRCLPQRQAASISRCEKQLRRLSAL